MADTAVLLREFLRAPTRIATITASSPALVDEMLRPFPHGADPVVVELGAGTGRVTGAVAQRLGGRGRHLAVERNPVLARRLAARHPAVTVVRGDAAALPDILAEHGITEVDLVASLLPWAAYRDAPIAATVAAALAPDGVFAQVTFTVTQWLAPARRQLRDARALFTEVHRGPLVWRNLPPARVRIARGARAVDAGG